MGDALLEVRDLCTYLRSPRGIIRAVDHVDFSVESNKIRALVGESGSGKSITALTIMQLLPEPAGYVEDGSILFEGRDLLDLTWAQMRALRGKDISMIFQEPMTSLNPAYTIGNQVREAAIVHGKSAKEASGLALDLLSKVGIEDPVLTLRQYPHELSGGMRQRVMIAMALANQPKLLIADEPTTALDVTVQAQILRLIRDMQREFGMAVLLITHDLAVVAEMADDVSVMYAGQIVEEAPVRQLFKNPKHPYTKDLLESLPARRLRGQDLAVITGTVPDAANWPSGCRYASRCRSAFEKCMLDPPLGITSSEAVVRCHLFDTIHPEDPQEDPK